MPGSGPYGPSVGGIIAALSGPDVSEHQGDVDWDRVATEHQLALVRVADGDYRDRFYNEARVAAIRAAGLLLGPYHFGRVASPGNRERSGEDEAALATSQARAGGWRWPGDLPLAYDFETANNQALAKCANHLVEFVAAYHASERTYPLIYTAPAFWRSVLPHVAPADRELIGRCPLWLAHWAVTSPDQLEPWDRIVLWQYTDSGSVPGIPGPVDLNRALASAEEVRALATGPPEPSPVPAPEPAPLPGPPGGAPADAPPDLPAAFYELWRRPWGDQARASAEFRAWLWEGGRLSPHFARDEARCHDPGRSAVPKTLAAASQRHAFNLERLRHRLGDRPLRVLSWYRTPAWNAHVGGASQSRHLSADATDLSREEVVRFPGFDQIADEVFSDGGFGTYPSGARHVDSRGSRARWSSF